jgi:transcription termination factor Rho
MALDLTELKTRDLSDLLALADQLKIDNAASLKRQDLIFEILRSQVGRGPGTANGTGVLETLPDGFGFLRAPDYNYLPGPDDIYVSPSQIRRFNLRTGDLVDGQIRAPKEGEKYFALLKIERVNGRAPDEERNKVLFDNLEAQHAERRLPLEATPALRMIDLLAPLGLGHRIAIHGPLHAGRTRLIVDLVNGFAQAEPDIVPLVVLVDERPEEIDEIKKAIRGEVLASTFDEPPARHAQVADMALERAKRMVEQGHDVLLVLDSLTRLTRAYAATVPAGGRMLYGVVDVLALQKARRFFGAGRNIRGPGSLTTIATVLTNTGSELNDVLLEDLQGMANAEIHLSPDLQADGLFPAIDVARTCTHQAERLVPPDELQARTELRKSLLAEADPWAHLRDLLARDPTNAQLLQAGDVPVPGKRRPAVATARARVQGA